MCTIRLRTYSRLAKRTRTKPNLIRHTSNYFTTPPEPQSSITSMRLLLVFVFISVYLCIHCRSFMLHLLYPSLLLINSSKYVCVSVAFVLFFSYERYKFVSRNSIL